MDQRPRQDEGPGQSRRQASLNQPRSCGATAQPQSGHLASFWFPARILGEGSATEWAGFQVGKGRWCISKPLMVLRHTRRVAWSALMCPERTREENEMSP